MRFSTRTFLSSFLPFAFLLTVSFWLIQQSVLSTVREELRTSLRNAHLSVAKVQAKSEIHNNRFLRVLGENSSIKAGLQLINAESDVDAAKLTLLDQLGEFADTHSFNLLAVAGADGKPIAGVIRTDGKTSILDGGRVWPGQRGFYSLGGRMFQLASVPVNLGEENLGMLTVGELFDFSDFSTPTVLLWHGGVVQSTIPRGITPELETALRSCGEHAECEVKVAGTTYLSLPVETLSLGDGYVLRSFQDVDAASAPVQGILSRVFLIAGGGALLAALILSALSTRSIVKPLATVVERLRESERTHELPEFPSMPSSVPEIRELTTSFNHAAASIREGREFLQRAYVGFISSLASAIDARDRYTAGHSERVSRMATETAKAMQLPEKEVERIRIGALLHDVGKIGIPDAILQKPGRLTVEEFAQIKEHPSIGKRILEPVGGFEEYLPIVELHHENWDGTGYPRGLKGLEVPVGARIVHVVDAYDAITTDRPYRPGSSHQRAISLLVENSGTQFDGDVVEAFLSSPTGSGSSGSVSTAAIVNLAEAAGTSVAPEAHPAAKEQSA